MSLLYFHAYILFTLQSASKEHSARSVEIVVTVTLAFVAIRSAATAFVRKGELGTSVTKVLFAINLFISFLQFSYSTKTQTNLLNQKIPYTLCLILQFVQKAHMVAGALSGVAVLQMRNVIQWKELASVQREGLGNTVRKVSSYLLPKTSNLHSISLIVNRRLIKIELLLIRVTESFPIFIVKLFPQNR